MKAVFLDFATVSCGDLDVTRLRRLLPDLELFDVTRTEQIGERTRGAAVVLVNKLAVNAAAMAANPALKLVVLAATGTNNVDLEAARRLGIGVCNIRDYCTPSVVQHVFAVLLSLTHGLREYERLAREEWASSPQFTMLSQPIRELNGRVLGIVGYGVLGRAVARAAEAFGMKIEIANRPGGERQPGRFDLHELLPRADVLSLHCPLTPATAGLLGARELGLMKSDAVIINTARGALIDVEALAQALRQKRIGGAAIDVLPQEPPRDGSPLFAADIPNLILTPHTAWAARESRQRALDEMAANIEDFLRGGRRGRVA
ncbi:MAG TPA: NAD(P)-dependent oxidoreductase [Steroidobacteraceae bacterium]|nr:NAD(P)-dependent oxidoreductase [Steroidobacteraceae bacterium]